MRRAIFLVLLLLTTSCATPPHEASTPTPPPVLIHLPGIGGELSIDHHLTRGLLDGHAAATTEIIDWTGDDRGPRSLGNIARHKEWAQRVAQRIEAIHTADPRTPIILVGHSAGTGIAVWALEDLPPEIHIRTLLLLASALSPGYDLSPALRHVDGHALNVYSKYDAVVLGAGTSMFGTVDRVKTPAAGMTGFHTPSNADEAEYAKLLQFPYDDTWAAYGNPGDHIGPMSRRFAEQVLAPLLNRDSAIASNRVK